MPQISCTYISVWGEEEALFAERLVVSDLASTPPLFSTVYQCDRCLSSQVRESSWLGHQVLPTVSAIVILELAPYSGS